MNKRKALIVEGTGKHTSAESCDIEIEVLEKIE